MPVFEDKGPSFPLPVFLEDKPLFLAMSGRATDKIRNEYRSCNQEEKGDPKITTEALQKGWDLHDLLFPPCLEYTSVMLFDDNKVEVLDVSWSGKDKETEFECTPFPNLTGQTDTNTAIFFNGKVMYCGKVKEQECFKYLHKENR